MYSKSPAQRSCGRESRQGRERRGLRHEPGPGLRNRHPRPLPLSISFVTLVTLGVVTLFFLFVIFARLVAGVLLLLRLRRAWPLFKF